MAGPWRNRAHTVLSQGKSLVPSWGPQASTRWFLKSSKRGRQLGSVQHALPTGLQWGEGAMGAGGGGALSTRTEKPLEMSTKGKHG